MHQQRGAQWMAQQQREIGAATLPPVAEEGGDPHASGHSDQHEPPRYHLVDCMTDRALSLFAQVCREYGFRPPEMV
jgi:hypothetical protein